MTPSKHAYLVPYRSAFCFTALAGLLLSISASVCAQDTDDDEESTTGTIEEVIVTGTAGGSEIRKFDASFSITTMDDNEIEKFSPKSTADLFKAVPGVWSESSGGQSGANVFVRGFPGGGDAEFLTVQLEGSPIFPPPTLSFLENSTLFRIDETIERMEALRGGPNPVLSNGQPGLTTNFLLKRGGPEPEGLIKYTYGDYDSNRVDAVYSGPLGEDTYIMLGGYYRASSGIRDAQFTSEKGGQFTVNLTRELERGTIDVYGRVTDDHGAWLLPIPLRSSGDGGSLSEFPGFDTGTGTYHGNETRFATIEVGNGATITRDLSDGRGANIVVLGGSMDFDLQSNWVVRDRFNYLKGDADTMGLVPANVPETLASVLAAADPGGVGGNFTLVSDGSPLNDLGTLVQRVGWWSVEKDLQSFTNDLSLSRAFDNQSTLTLGLYVSNFSSDDLWYLGNEQLLTAESNGRRVDGVLNDGSQITRDGFSGAPFFNVNAGYDGNSTAFYAVYDYPVNDRLTIDAGLRYEDYEVDATLENNDFGVDIDGDPSTLFNNSAAVLNGTFRTIEFNNDKVSWTAGANYLVSDTFSVFGRINTGSKFPQFDDLRDGADVTKEVDQYELGLKYLGESTSVYGTFFYNEFTGNTFQRFINNMSVTQSQDSEAFGIEIEATQHFDFGLDLDLNLTYLDSELTNDANAANVGNQLQRQPDVNLRFTPSWSFKTGRVDGVIYSTLTHVGDRFSDNENAQPLGSYQKLDVGVQLYFGDHLNFQIVADNLTDEDAITEGNPRIVGAQTGAFILGRPILGRSFKFSVGYEF